MQNYYTSNTSVDRSPHLQRCILCKECHTSTWVLEHLQRAAKGHRDRVALDDSYNSSNLVVISIVRLNGRLVHLNTV
jgi:hypothetical protein